MSVTSRSNKPTRTYPPWRRQWPRWWSQQKKCLKNIMCSWTRRSHTTHTCQNKDYKKQLRLRPRWHRRRTWFIGSVERSLRLCKKSQGLIRNHYVQRAQIGRRPIFFWALWPFILKRRDRSKNRIIEIIKNGISTRWDSKDSESWFLNPINSFSAASTLPTITIIVTSIPARRLLTTTK